MSHVRRFHSADSQQLSLIHIISMVPIKTSLVLLLASYAIAAPLSSMKPLSDHAIVDTDGETPTREQIVAILGVPAPELIPLREAVLKHATTTPSIHRGESRKRPLDSVRP
jgi:hypothetical protein